MTESDATSHTTGHLQVDAVLARLESLDDVDLVQQLATYHEMQASLAAVLDTDESDESGESDGTAGSTPS